jgi:hypothetical protein
MDHLLDFLEVPLIKQMLMLDIAFYGIGLADILGGKYSPEQDGSIQAYCPSGTVSHVHRLLQFYGGHKKLVQANTYFAKSVACVYTFPALHNLQIELRFENPPMNSCIPKSFANVGNLYVTRTGLHCLGDVEDCTPFTQTLRDCTNRVCTIDEHAVLQPNLYANIRTLVRNHWTVRNLKLSVVEAAKGQKSGKCPICHEPLEGKILETACKHQFCQECWEQYWQSNSHGGPETAFRFNLQSSPAIISCPMCRREYRSWEVVPIETLDWQKDEDEASTV